MKKNAKPAKTTLRTPVALAERDLMAVIGGNEGTIIVQNGLPAAPAIGGGWAQD